MLSSSVIVRLTRRLMGIDLFLGSLKPKIGTGKRLALAKEDLEAVRKEINDQIKENAFERTPEDEALYRDELYKIVLVEMIRVKGTKKTNEKIGSAAVEVVNDLLARRSCQLSAEKRVREDKK